jgi:hypothetical protein
VRRTARPRAKAVLLLGEEQGGRPGGSRPSLLPPPVGHVDRAGRSVSGADVVNQVRDRRLVLSVPRNEAYVGAHTVEQAGALPQDHWDEVQADLVEQSIIQELLRNVCPAVDQNVQASRLPVVRFPGLPLFRR